MQGKIWIFTGGAHAVGGFSENRGFRNAAGLFEEVIRWDMRGDGPEGSENYVFNTAGAGLDVWDIFKDFEMRIGRYHPAGVVYISGAEDRKLDNGRYKEGLSALKHRTEESGAVFLELSDTSGEGKGSDPLWEANQLLAEVCSGSSLVKPEDRNRFLLRPATESFERNGKLELKESPMRWLFIGDSITHGALHTFGYDSLPQLWEKYIRGDWGRRDDVVLNTGVSGATAGEFLGRLDVRYTPYKDADVVVAMFGTNDCWPLEKTSIGEFREQLRRIVDLAHSHGSQVILRTPQPQRKDGERRAALAPFAEAARETAVESGVLLVDHFHNFSILEKEKPEHFLAYMSDAVHPNARGQYRMFREMAYAVDMVLEHSMVSLEYEV